MSGLIPEGYWATIGRFSREQFIIWLRFVEDPVALLSEVDLHSRDSAIPALSFTFFVTGFSFLLGLPGILVRHGLMSPDQSVAYQTVLAQAVLTFLGLVLLGPFLFIWGWILRGRGTFGASLIAGLYLTALWPFAQALLYLTLGDPGLEEHAHNNSMNVVDYVHVFVFLACAIIVLYVWVVKTARVVRHVHNVGAVRAIVAAVLVCVSLLAFFSVYVSVPRAALWNPPSNRPAAGGEPSNPAPTRHH